MKNFEIELRYEILSSSQLANFIQQFTKVGTKRDIDIYFDNAQLELYQKGIFIRMRNERTFDIKFNRACLEDPTLPLQDYCEEYIFSLPLKSDDLDKLNPLLLSLSLQPVEQADFGHFLKINKLSEHYRVDKTRTTYTHDDLTIAVDEVANLGAFIEIEALATSLDDLEEIKQRMQLLLLGLELKPFKSGYGAMLLRKRNFQEYLLGRFIAPEDKIQPA